MKQTELKPCPFCGGEADCGSFHGVAFFYVQCSCCGNGTKMYATAKAAAEKWNTRTNVIPVGSGEDYMVVLK